MLGDDAAAWMASLYEVDEVKSLTNFEAAGLKFALLSFVQFDLDGNDATMRTDAWSSDEEHEPLPHRQGVEVEVERMLRWGRKRCVDMWDTFLEFFQGLFGDAGVEQALTYTTVHLVVAGVISQRRGLEPGN